MLFNSLEFLCLFLPVALALCLALPWRNAALLTVSLAFYAWGEGAYLLVLLGSIALNHGCGLLVAAPGRRGACWLALGIAANLALLGWFKYAVFLQTALLRPLGLLEGEAPLGGGHLPLGISFFTFQCISYLVDVRRGLVPADRDPLRFATYVALFPHLLAGPIVRYAEVAEALRRRQSSLLLFGLGLRIALLGLMQKVLLADQLAPVADRLFALPPDLLPAGAAWFGAAAFSLQIYFDFAGYSNMAIGLALMLGFRFPRNFERPYAAQSLTEFWRRWHITLSRWFRDYLYRPLGGNRRGRLTTLRNLLLVFLLCGLWHGAAWTFVAWGLAHGAVLVLERAVLGRALARAWRPLRHLYLHLVLLPTWVLFRANDLDHALDYLGAMLGQGRPPDAWVALGEYLRPGVLLPFLAGLLAAVLPPPRALAEQFPEATAAEAAGLARAARRPLAWALVPLLALGLAACLTLLVADSERPFLYFRF